MSSLLHFLTRPPADPVTVGQSLWMIIAFPLVGAALCGILGRNLGRGNTQFIACATVASSFVLSLLAAWATVDASAAISSPFSSTPVRYAVGHDFGTWFSAGSFRANFGLKVDHLSGTMVLVITGVGLLIHIYSTEYMSRDEGYWRYFAYLNLFVAMMLTLVLADNLTLLFVGWEGVGLCSYLLIGFWYEDPAKAWAGRKAFVVNRIGDFGFLVGAFLLILWTNAWDADLAASAPANAVEQWHRGLSAAGPLHFQGLEELAKFVGGGQSGHALSRVISAGPLAGYTFGGVLTAVMLLLMMGAAGKSAQLPLYVWLPDAMAGPTPVSALIHAATMVTAGVYLLCRMGSLLVLSPLAMTVVAVVGATTALFAALIAFAQTDIKKVLAYSTISQLGFMFMAAGMGIFWAAILHLVTHAFFKACLFLGAGSVMHGNAGETNIMRLGGLRRQMPWTWLTFLIATVAITGFAIPLSGFFSKDAILDGVHATHLKGYPWASNIAWLLGLFAAFCTAFYMGRLYLLTFEGQRSTKAAVPAAHESGWAMTIPLAVLAALSILGAIYGIPLLHAGGRLQPIMENYLSPVFASFDRLALVQALATPRDEGNWVASWTMTWVIALIGGGVAGWFYLKLLPEWNGRPVPAVARAVRRWAENKFYVDELYDTIVVRPITGGSKFLYRVLDSMLIDTLAVRGTAWATARVGSALRYLQTGNAQSYAAIMALAVAGALVYAVLQVIR